MIILCQQTMLASSLPRISYFPDSIPIVSMPRKFLILSDQIDEQTLMLIIQLGQIIREIAEVIADTHFDMIA
jgi:hypothetical protein